MSDPRDDNNNNNGHDGNYEEVSAEGEDNFGRNEKIADLGDGAIPRTGEGDEPDALGETDLGENRGQGSPEGE